MMRQIKNIIRDVLYVSKITKVNNKKILIFFVTILSQFTALTDIAIIAIFASIIANQGVLVYSNFHANFANTRDRGRQKLDINWYIPANDAGLAPQYSNRYPQPRNEGNFWRNDGVGYYHDASFVKVKNIAFGYSFSDNILDKF